MRNYISMFNIWNLIGLGVKELYSPCRGIRKMTKGIAKEYSILKEKR